MNNRKYIQLLFSVSFVFAVYSCESFLDPELNNNITTDQAFADKEWAQGILINAYAAIPKFYAYYGSDFLDCATDDAISTRANADVSKMSYGGWSASTNPIDRWGTSYTQIRNINLFLLRGFNLNYYKDPSNKAKDKALKQRLLGEAYFLRAWHQWELLKNHGGKASDGRILGFPIVTKIYTVEDRPVLPRNTYEECVAQIKSDCDSAIKYLPAQYNSSGNPDLDATQTNRATSLAAYALKSRVFLYAASPAFRAPGISTDSVKKLWERAAIAADMAIDTINKKLGIAALPNFTTSTFNDYKATNTECIVRLPNQSTDNDPEATNFPPSLFGKGMTNPSQNLVDAFPMANGYPIDNPAGLYNPSDPYGSKGGSAARDPRLALTVLYNGASFKSNVIQTFNGGKDNITKRSEATLTGYYLRKWLSATTDLTPNKTKNDYHYFALFRQAELYINYAEAANEAWGPTTDVLSLGRTAQSAIRAVRGRANATLKTSDPYITGITTQDEFRKAVRNERRIEFAFENQRFYDLRRWYTSSETGVADTTVLNVPVYGVAIDTTGGSLKYTKILVAKRKYLDFMGYGPIPYDELFKNSGVLQNFKW